MSEKREKSTGETPSRIPGYMGNRNAKKEEVRDAHIHLRVMMDQKTRFVRAAQAEGKKLSPWLIDLAVAASKKSEVTGD